MLKIAHHPLYAHPLPEKHRFPMLKYELIPEQLLYEGTISKEQIFTPSYYLEEEILLTHSQDYWDKLRFQQLTKREARKIGFPQSSQLIKREITICHGTLECHYFSKEFGIAMNTSGGTHHAYADRGEGFCLLNDIAMAANVILRNEPHVRILIVDLDVHQGNGSAKIFEHEDRVFTFSMHGEKNYPVPKEKSDLDIGLPTYCEDPEYLIHLKDHLPSIIQQFRPDYAFYLSGVDVLATDKLGQLSLSKEACAERDRFTLEQLMRNGIPTTVAMGGGYSPQIRDIVDAHCTTYRIAQSLL